MKLYLSSPISGLKESFKKYLYGEECLYQELITENIEILIYEQLIGVRRFTWTLIIKEIESTYEVTIIFSGVDGLFLTEKHRVNQHKKIVKYFKSDGLEFETDL